MNAGRLLRAGRAGLSSLCLTIFAAIFLTALAAWLALESAGARQGEASRDQIGGDLDGTPYYFPLVRQDPTVTPTMPPPIPQFVTEIALPGQQCPLAADANPVSGYTYVAAPASDNVAVLDGLAFLTTVATGEWAGHASSDPNSARTYVTNLHGPISALDHTAVVTQFPSYFEPFVSVVNPVNGYVYVGDLGGAIRVLDGSAVATDIVPDNAGWVLSVAVDPDSGLTYAASWEHGQMYVINGTQLVHTFRVGHGPRNIAVDPVSHYVYVAHSAPNAAYPHNISVFLSGTQPVTTTFSTAVRSQDVAVDPLGGYSYFANSEDNSVTVLRYGQLVNTLPVGILPWAVTVHPDTGYAFVVNRGSDSVSILKDGAIVTTLPTGGQPSDVAVDTVNDYVYVVNTSFEVECNDVGQCHDICLPASVTVLR